MGRGHYGFRLVRTTVRTRITNNDYDEKMTTVNFLKRLNSEKTIPRHMQELNILCSITLIVHFLKGEAR